MEEKGREGKKVRGRETKGTGGDGNAMGAGRHGRKIALSELPSGTPLILTNSGNIAKLLSGERPRQTIYLSISTGDR